MSSQGEAQSNRTGGYLEWLPTGETLPDGAHEARHHRITLALLAHVPFLLALGVFTGTMPVTEAVIPETPLWRVGVQTGLLVGVALAARYSGLSRRQQTGLSVVGWMLATMQLVQFSGGYIETHFHFFVAIGVLASYEDWLPFGLGLAYVIVGHGLFATVFEASRVYNHSAAINNPWVWGGVHGFFVLLLAASEISNWRSIINSREESQRRLEMVDQKKAEMQSIEETKAQAEQRREEMERLKQALESRAAQYRQQMEAAAAGDLSVRLDTDAESDAMVDIANAFNEMLSEVETTVDEIKLFADRVESASESTLQRVAEAQDKTTTVTETLEEATDQTAQQRDQLAQAADEMSTLSATIEEVASSASEVSRTADATADAATDGAEAVEETITQTTNAQQAAEETVDAITTVNSQMEEISEIVDLISDIAEQTDMLAVNATIEAARAGDGDGGSDGFAVVAEEVKQLAEEVQEAATEVEAQLKTVQSQTTTAVTAAESAVDDADDAAATVEEAGERFDQVTEYAGDTSSGVTEISHATDDQAASTEETVSIVEDALETSKQTVEYADRLATASEEQAHLMDEISADSDSLTTRAQELQDLLTQFTTGSDSGHRSEVEGSASPRPTAMGDGGSG